MLEKPGARGVSAWPFPPRNHPSMFLLHSVYRIRQRRGPSKHQVHRADSRATQRVDLDGEAVAGLLPRVGSHGDGNALHVEGASSVLFPVALYDLDSLARGAVTTSQPLVLVREFERGAIFAACVRFKTLECVFFKFSLTTFREPQEAPAGCGHVPTYRHACVRCVLGGGRSI